MRPYRHLPLISSSPPWPLIYSTCLVPPDIWINDPCYRSQGLMVDWLLLFYFMLRTLLLNKWTHSGLSAETSFLGHIFFNSFCIIKVIHSYTYVWYIYNNGSVVYHSPPPGHTLPEIYLYLHKQGCIHSTRPPGGLGVLLAVVTTEWCLAHRRWLIRWKSEYVF